MGFYDNYKERQTQVASGSDYAACPLPNGLYHGTVKGVGYKSGRSQKGLEWVRLTLALRVAVGEHKGTEVDLEVFGIEGNDRSELRFWGALAILGYPSIAPENLVDVLTDDVMGVRGKTVEFRVKHGEKGVFMDLLKVVTIQQPEESYPF